MSPSGRKRTNCVAANDPKRTSLGRRNAKALKQRSTLVIGTKRQVASAPAVLGVEAHGKDASAPSVFSEKARPAPFL